MKKQLRGFFIILIASLLLICGCGVDHTGEVKIPKSSSECKHKNYREIESLFESAGFTNIRLEKLEDLIFGWVTKDGEVDMVIVGGSENFDTWDWFSEDAEVIIYYHTFPNSDKDEKTAEENNSNDTEDVQNTSDNSGYNNSSNSSSANTSSSNSTSSNTGASNNSSSSSSTTNNNESNTIDDMPKMNGTSVQTVSTKASEYGLNEVYDMDFGNGTRCKELSDSAGGLMLTLIYSTSSKELLCATIVTNNIASADSQINFIKGISPVLCPSTFSDSVSEWVNSNIGTEIETNIGSRTYSLELGPVNNLLYYAGYIEWEQWDLNQ